MSICPLTNPDDINNAFTVLSERLATDGQALEKFIGWPGGVGAVNRTIHWHPNEQIWTLSDSWDEGYWFGFGLENPNFVHHFAPTFQISLPRQGVNRRFAGRFLRDGESGRTFVAHSGKIGGGTLGVGKNAFLAYYGPNNQTMVDWPDGQRTQYIVVGELTDENLLDQIATLVRRVADFKQEVRN